MKVPDTYFSDISGKEEQGKVGEGRAKQYF